MDMGFSCNVDFLSDYYRSSGLFLLRNISAAFSADQSDCPAADRSVNSVKPAYSHVEQRRDMPRLFNLSY